MDEKEIIETLKSPLLESDGYNRHQKAIERFIRFIQARKKQKQRIEK